MRISDWSSDVCPSDLSLVEEARALAESSAEGRRIVWTIGLLPMVIGDANMLRTVWQNLLGNAVKYTGRCEVASIEVSAGRSNRRSEEHTSELQSLMRNSYTV